MAYNITDWENIDKFLTIVRTVDRFEKCETVYDLFGIKDKNTSYSEVEIIIDSFVKTYAGSNAPKYKDIGRKISGEAERIKSVLKDHRKEYNDYLKKNDPRINRLRQNFDFCTKKDKVLDSKEKARLIEHGIDDGLAESEIITCIHEWLIDSGVKEAGKDSYNSSTSANFVLIHGGEFTMGSPGTEVGRIDDETQHQVKVNDFYMGKYPVTVAEFKRFIAETGYQTDAEIGYCSRIWNGSEVKDEDGINWRHGVSGRVRSESEENHPVIHVSRNDAVEYCRWLSDKTGKWYRLPTEAEWEYACRAGSRTPFNTGENLTTDQANYDGDYPYNNNPQGVYRQNTVVVNSFAPNAWGLYNMHGNVWECCSDWFDGIYYDYCKTKGTVTNPCGPDTGSMRVLRGGSLLSNAMSCRSAYRKPILPVNRAFSIGFRLVFVP